MGSRQWGGSVVEQWWEGVFHPEGVCRTVGSDGGWLVPNDLTLRGHHAPLTLVITSCCAHIAWATLPLNCLGTVPYGSLRLVELPKPKLETSGRGGMSEGQRRD